MSTKTNGQNDTLTITLPPLAEWQSAQLARLQKLRGGVQEAQGLLTKARHSAIRSKSEALEQAQNEYEAAYRVLTAQDRERREVINRQYDQEIGPALTQVTDAQSHLHDEWGRFYEDAKRLYGVDYQALFAQYASMEREE